MKFSDYETIVEKTDLNCSVNGDRLAYALIGMIGEIGEFAEKVKRIYRKDHELNADYKHLLALELGDVLWYLTKAAKELGYKLEDIARLNLEKLEKRLKENKIRGKGDLR